MSFFKNKIVKIVAWILWAVSTVVLLIGGCTQEALSGALVAVAGAVGGVSAVVILIASLIKGKEEKKE